MITSILVVSEDPVFAVAVHERFAPLGIDVTTCLGPANTPCGVDGPRRCPLASAAGVVVVDAPPSGEFHHEWSSIPAGDYAHRLAHAHAGTRVLLVGAPEGLSRPTGDVLAVSSRAEVLALIEAGSPGRSRVLAP